MVTVGKNKTLGSNYNYIINHVSIYSKNENYLARFIPLFEKQVGMDLNAEQMLTEIIRDNAYVTIYT